MSDAPEITAISGTRRQCIGCTHVLDLSAFGFKNKATGRRDTRCKACRKVYIHTHYTANKARYHELSSKWRRDNPEQTKAITRRYIESHREDHARRGREWAAKRKAARPVKPARTPLTAQELKDRIRANDLRRRAAGYFSAWKKRNKVKVNASTARRRARIKAANGGHHKHDIQMLVRSSKGQCYWCRRPFGQRYEVDHVWPVALGGEDHVGNLCLACPTCNRRKSKTPPTVFAGVLL